MTLRELVQKIDKSKSYYTDFERFYDNEVDYEKAYEHFKAYPIAVWNCTDTHVGVFALFLDNEFVGIKTQYCRKCDVNFEWVSEGAFKKVKEFLDSISTEYIPTIDIDEETDMLFIR